MNHKLIRLIEFSSGKAKILGNDSKGILCDMIFKFQSFSVVRFDLIIIT